MEIYTKKGEPIIIDDDDYNLVSNYNWQINNHGYAYARKMVNGKRVLFLMHRLILNAPSNKMVDHINGNRVDNRKINIRLCTNQENQWNAKKRKGNNNYKGVTFNKKKNKYNVLISIKSKISYIGTFEDEIAAANAYNYHATQEYGEFALLNDVPFMEKEEWEKSKYTKEIPRGVSYHKSSGRYQARTTIGNIAHHIGTFDDPIQAYNAYLNYKKKSTK